MTDMTDMTDMTTEDDIPLAAEHGSLARLSSATLAALPEVAAVRRMASAPRTVQRVLAPADATELIGTPAPALAPTPTLLTPGTGLWLDADTGEPLLGLFPMAELSTFRAAVLAAMPAVSMSTYRTGLGIANTSVTFGYRTRKPLMSRDSCALTAFNRDYPDSATFLGHYSDVLGAQLAAAFPEIALQGLAAIDQVEPDWRLTDDSLWTSGVINKESALPYHRDGNNFAAWSVMPVLRSGVLGGHLHLPEYDLVIPCRDGIAVAFFGQALVHGVTPMSYAPGRNPAALAAAQRDPFAPAELRSATPGYRVSTVYYALKGMKDCATFAAETARGREVRTARESTIAAALASGAPSPAVASEHASLLTPEREQLADDTRADSADHAGSDLGRSALDAPRL